MAPVPAGMRINATIIRSPSMQAPFAVEYAGPPRMWLTLARSNKNSPSPARLAPGVRAVAVSGAIVSVSPLRSFGFRQLLQHEVVFHDVERLVHRFAGGRLAARRLLHEIDDQRLLDAIDH